MNVNHVKRAIALSATAIIVNAKVALATKVMYSLLVDSLCQQCNAFQNVQHKRG